MACAAFGFDADTFAPTYQLVYGTPGRSLALEIAARLGLNPSVIAAARQNVSAREAQLAEHLAKIDRDMRALEHEQRLVARERETLGAAEARMRQREDALKQREETYRKRLTEELDAEVRMARREIESVIAGLKVKTDRIAQDAARHVTTGDTGGVRSEARAAVDAVAKRFVEPAHAAPAPAAAPSLQRPAAVGDRVTVGGLGLEGVVTSIHDGTLEVDVRGKRMRAHLRDVTVVGGPSAAAAARVSVHVELQPREAAAADLNVIGCTVDEAIDAGGAISGRVAARRPARGAVHSRLRHRTAETGAGRLPPAASAGRQISDRPARTGRRRRDRRGAQGLTWVCFRRHSSTTSACRPTSCRSCRSTSR